MIDYIAKVSKILENDKDVSDIILDLGNLLIPRLMHIPNNVIPEILEILEEQSALFEEESIYPLPILIQALMNYKCANYQLGIQLVNPVLDNPLFEYSDAMKGLSYSILGMNHRSLGERDIAFKHFQNALELYPEEIEESYLGYLYGVTLYHIAEIYGELKEYDEMLVKHELFYKNAQVQENRDFEYRALNGLARAYIGLGMYDVALSYFQTAADSSKIDGNKPFIARNLHDLGYIFDLLEDREQSLLHYQEALDIRIENEYKNAAITTQIAISQVLIKQQKYQEAIEILEAAKTAADVLKVKRKSCKIIEILSTIYEEIQDFEYALKYHKLFHELKAALDNVDKTQIEAQRVREANTQLKQQKTLIENQKKQIETTLQKLQVTNKYLENFATVAAHDLKAPIRIASSFARIIERKYNDKWDNSDAEYFAYITTNIGKLSQMIDDLLALSKLDQDLLPANKVNVPYVLREVEKRLAEKIVSTKAVLAYQQSIPNLMAHTSLITQLFQNLIDNAIKYRKEATPSIQIKTRLLNDNFCEFEIKDNGKGITGEEQKYIFELFKGTSRKDSSGIGLATCKKIVTHYGGRIWIESTEDIGTSIFLTLPLA